MSATANQAQPQIDCSRGSSIATDLVELWIERNRGLSATADQLQPSTNFNRDQAQLLIVHNCKEEIESRYAIIHINLKVIVCITRQKAGQEGAMRVKVAKFYRSRLCLCQYPKIC